MVPSTRSRRVTISRVVSIDRLSENGATAERPPPSFGRACRRYRARDAAITGRRSRTAALRRFGGLLAFAMPLPSGHYAWAAGNRDHGARTHEGVVGMGRLGLFRCSSAVVSSLAVLAACGSGGSSDSSRGTSSTAGPDTSASSTEVAATTTTLRLVPTTSSTPPAPLCDNREQPAWLAWGSFPADGPDPRGRIFFGQLARAPDVLGQIVGPLFAVDPDGSDLVQVLDCKIQRPRVSPDGTRLAFSIAMDDETLQVATANVDGSDLRILTSTPGFAETPDWSTDGSWLIYSLASQRCTTTGEDCFLKDGVRSSLWRMDTDGGNQQRIGEPDTVDWEPRLSPDGHQVVFSRFDLEPGLKMRLVIRDLDTGQERDRVDDSHHLEHPDWSPDGQWIIYNPTCGDACEQVEQVPANNLDAEPDVLYPADDTHFGYKPVYAPDGTQIVFGCEVRLCVMNADGSNPQILVDAPGPLNHFDWGVSPT